MNFLTFLVLLLISTNLYSQSIDSKRLERVKKSVVRILIQGRPSGTGFIVSKTGSIVTCWHVIEPALIYDSLKRMRKIEAEFAQGEKVELGIDKFSIKNGVREAVGYDYCYLLPIKPINSSFEFLSLGNFNDVNEGDQVYTIGYPLGIEQQFVSTGIISTKWIENKKFLNSNSLDSISRNVAWLDLTMNAGNSGGPIIRIGKTPSDDKVIGIATFILNPFAAESKIISELSGKLTMDMQFGGISQVRVNQLLTEAISNNSIGISGCISIDHFKSIYK